MFVNVAKLNGKIAERGMNKTQLAKLMGIDPSTLYRKLSGDCATLLVKDAIRIAEILELTAEECSEIFFAQKVA